MLTRHPMTTLLVGIVVLSIPGVYGLTNENAVTYDLSSQLNHSAASRRGLRLMSRHFEIGETNPVTVLLVREQEAPRKEFEKKIKDLATELYKIDGSRHGPHGRRSAGRFPPRS